MIIKSSMIRTSRRDLAATLRHVFCGPENEEILPVRRYPHDRFTAGETTRVIFRSAMAASHVNTFLHIKISPGIAIDPDAFGMVQDRLAEMLKLRPEFIIGQVHRKKRATGDADYHAHFYVPVHDPVTGRHLDLSHLRRRQERLARELEFEIGEPLTKGRHNLSVANALRRIGDERSLHLADRMKQDGLLDSAPALSAYSDRQFQHAKRRGYNLPILRRRARSAFLAGGIQALSGVFEREGLGVTNTQRRDAALLVDRNGRPVAELTRLIASGNRLRRRALVKAALEKPVRVRASAVKRSASDEIAASGSQAPRSDLVKARSDGPFQACSQRGVIPADNAAEAGCRENSVAPRDACAAAAKKPSIPPVRIRPGACPSRRSRLLFMTEGFRR